MVLLVPGRAQQRKAASACGGAGKEPRGLKAWPRNRGTLAPRIAADTDRRTDIVGQEGPPLPAIRLRSPLGLHGCSRTAGEIAIGPGITAAAGGTCRRPCRRLFVTTSGRFVAIALPGGVCIDSLVLT